MYLYQEKHGDVMSGLESSQWAQMLENYLNEIAVSDYTRRKYRREIGRSLKMLEEAGLETNPQKIGKREISYLYRIWTEQSIHPNYVKWRMNHLNLILRHYNNYVIQKMRMNLRQVKRTKVRWFKPEDTELIWAAAEQLGPQYEIRIHLGLDLLLRKIEMYRMKVTDIEFQGNGHGNLHVLGKGRDGGKPADLPFHPDTGYYMKRYLEWREEQFMKAETQGKKIREDARDALLIWYTPNRGIGKENYTTMDNRLIDIEKKMKEMFPEKAFHFSYHDLRRSGASQYYWIYGWDIVEVKELLRHEKLETTIEYLGIPYEIVQKAFWTHEGKRAGGPRNPLPLPTRNRLVSARF